MERDSESNEYGRPRRYENEDTTPTSDRELKGWYSYGLAAEIFAVAGVGEYVHTFNASILLTIVKVHFFQSPSSSSQKSEVFYDLIMSLHAGNPSLLWLKLPTYSCELLAALPMTRMRVNV